MKFTKSALLSLEMIGLASACLNDGPYQAHVKSVSESWEDPEVLITIGQTCNGYTPPGIPDGMGGYRFGNTVRIFVNHELSATSGTPYNIPTANEGAINGGRVSFLDINAKTRKLVDAGLAYKLIRARDGNIVRSSSDLDFSGIDRLCSAQFFEKGTYGLASDIFFTGEETDGGTEFAVNAVNGHMYAVPWMGRAAWESVTMFDQPDADHIAVLIGDDRGGAPLLLYVGEKLPGGFLKRNGLDKGDLYVWKSDNGPTGRDQINNPYLFSALNENSVSFQKGHFVQIAHYQPDMAGTVGFDYLGLADQSTQDDLSIDAGAFLFSRPEDLSTNPNNGLQAVFHSTGRSELYNQTELWGHTFQVDVNFDLFEPGQPIPADITVLYDGNVLGDNGIRSPDNGVWATDGIVYVQEDRSFGEFCDNGEEASIWALDPEDSSTERIYQVNRSAELPPGQIDTRPTDCGNWETSGIIDVADLFDKNHGCDLLLLATAQSHSVRGEFDGGELFVDGLNLEQGGQIFFLCKKA